MSIETGEERGAAQTARGGIPADTFANRLILARAFAGHLSIRDAAEMCRIGRGAWTNWEKGARPIDMLGTVEIISEKLGVDADWLLNGGPLSGGRRTRWALDRHDRRNGESVVTAPYLAAPESTSDRRGSLSRGRPPGRPDVNRRPSEPRRPTRLSPPIAA
jgi:transcriptional regulator with XRE-family HTH domain